MGKEKSPGLKILWLWTLGTAAIMVTNALRTRLRDMDEHHLSVSDQPKEDSIMMVDVSPVSGSDEEI